MVLLKRNIHLSKILLRKSKLVLWIKIWYIKNCNHKHKELKGLIIYQECMIVKILLTADYMEFSLVIQFQMMLIKEKTNYMKQGIIFLQKVMKVKIKHQVSSVE